MQFKSICIPLKPIIIYGTKAFNIIYLDSVKNINIILYKDYQYEKQQQFESVKKKILDNIRR